MTDYSISLVESVYDSINGLINDFKSDLFVGEIPKVCVYGDSKFKQYIQEDNLQCQNPTITVGIYQNKMDDKDNSDILIHTGPHTSVIEPYTTYIMKLDFNISVRNSIISKFLTYYHYYVKDRYFDYDNLINLLMIVKDAGEQFRQVLTDNLPYIDRWTIIDTGSTDNTVETIKQILGCKKGNLYQLPFRGFRDSRNECIELAKTQCVFNIMLDDTYIIKGDLRSFLSKKRKDREAESFSTYIQTDIKYISNRILFSNSSLRYIYNIHEVIQKNRSYLIPITVAYITETEDMNGYMRTRTKNRKESDLKLLFEEHTSEPTNARHLYYIAETYLTMEDYENAYIWYSKRSTYHTPSLPEETQDALYKKAYMAQLLGKDWNIVHQLYLQCFEFMPIRPESMYMIADHYLTEGSKNLAFMYLSKAFDCLQYKDTFQMNCKNNMYDNYIGYKILDLCYKRNNKLGMTVCEYLLEHSTIESFKQLASAWKLVYNMLQYTKPNKPYKQSETKVESIVFYMDGGWSQWDGYSDVEKGVGGSEKFVINYASTLCKLGYYVIVFCNCAKRKVCDGVVYTPIKHYFDYIAEYTVKCCIVNRYTEILSVNYLNDVPTYLVLHDLFRPCEVIINDDLLKGVLCVTNWHADYARQMYPMLKDKIHTISHGIKKETLVVKKEKEPYRFIYSSFPNRGLLELLKIFPSIVRKYPSARLDIFCDLDMPYIRQQFATQMSEIKKRLKEQEQWVKNHGWVSFPVLQKYWEKAHIWLYPCSFLETACLTGYEAAASKTLVITKHIAGLTETVGNRGFILPNTDDINQLETCVLNILEQIEMDSSYETKLVSSNYEWVKTKCYDNVVQQFVNNHLNKEI